MKAITLFAALALCAMILPTVLSAPAPKGLYISSRSYVVHLAKANFDKIVTKNRDLGVTIVHFYKSKGKSNIQKY